MGKISAFRSSSAVILAEKLRSVLLLACCTVSISSLLIRESVTANLSVAGGASLVLVQLCPAITNPIRESVQMFFRRVCIRLI
ncbi:hypothetical protein D3C85_1369270 [compost metagenome]